MTVTEARKLDLTKLTYAELQDLDRAIINSGGKVSIRWLQGSAAYGVYISGKPWGELFDFVGDAQKWIDTLRRPVPDLDAWDATTGEVRMMQRKAELEKLGAKVRLTFTWNRRPSPSRAKSGSSG